MLHRRRGVDVVPEVTRARASGKKKSLGNVLPPPQGPRSQPREFPGAVDGAKENDTPPSGRVASRIFAGAGAVSSRPPLYPREESYRISGRLAPTMAREKNPPESGPLITRAFGADKG